jgi:hypothetical protein
MRYQVEIVLVLLTAYWSQYTDHVSTFSLALVFSPPVLGS